NPARHRLPEKKTNSTRTMRKKASLQRHHRILYRRVVLVGTLSRTNKPVTRRRKYMAQWAYKVAYIDYRGRISSEGLETLIGNERRSTFARRYMNTLGKEGWELVGIQPLTANSAYY